MMNRKELEKFQGMFQEERGRILYPSAIQNETFAIASEETADESDLTSVEMERSLRMRLQNRETLFLKKVDEALRRIQDGSFGECVGCGDEIGLARLEVRPTASHCIECKEEEEKKELFYMEGQSPKSLGRLSNLATA